MSKSKKRGPGKPQGMNLVQTLAWMENHIEQLAEERALELFAKWSHSLIQQTRESDCIAAADTLGLGPETYAEFVATAKQYQLEIAQLIHMDHQDDSELVYSKEKIDQRIREISGDKFEPWEVRYAAD